MGFEALLVGCECVCFGMPFYAGWGITDDRSSSFRAATRNLIQDNGKVKSIDNEELDSRLRGNDRRRRGRKLTVEEVFAAAYILYTRYYNPYTKQKSDIFDTIETIIKLREKT